MPELRWVGKEKVVNHHHDVPFRILEKQYNFGAAENSGNKIIHGDNLAALKSLLPEYEGRVKCVYIDPPYNTGNESWVYNDNVNDAKMKKWLGQVVGKEGEDLSRHDKWLCMMYPRLKLLRKLLADDGVIFISIDDNEQANLKLIMDEIFGAANFIVNVLWQKKYAVANDHKTIAPMHDFVLVYRKSAQWQRNLLPRTEENNKQYRFADKKGIFRPDNYTCNKNADERPNLYYPIVNPNTGLEILPNRNAVWRYTRERHQENIGNEMVYWGKYGKGKVPAYKRYKHLLKNDGVVPSSWWTHEFAGHTDESKKEIRSILFDNTVNSDFITPKPVKLIERILQIATDKDSIVLDSFAGSGTTAHSVLKLNQADGGGRKFILIETMDYAETITAERVRRVMNGYGENGKAVGGLGGAFDYYEIGAPLFLADGNINESIGADEIRRYVAYSENLAPENQTAIDNEYSPYLLGIKDDAAYFFYYEPNRATTLNSGIIARLEELNDYGFFGSATERASILDMSQPVIVRLHMTQNEVLQNAMASFALLNIYQNMLLRGSQPSLTHAVIFDEAHRAGKLKLLPTMAKESRKFGISMIVASQEAKDFNDSLYAAIANYLVLRITETDAKMLAKNVVQSTEANAIAGRLKSLDKYTAMFFTEGKRPVVLRLSA